MILDIDNEDDDNDDCIIVPNFSMEYDAKKGICLTCLIAGKPVAETVKVKWIKKYGLLEFRATPASKQHHRQAEHGGGGVEVEISTIIIEYQPQENRLGKVMVQQMPLLKSKLKVVVLRKNGTLKFHFQAE